MSDAKNPPTPLDDAQPWFRQMTRYHWFVFIVAALGWLFDTMDQQLFTLTRHPAMSELISTPDQKAAPDQVKYYGGLATSIFIIGWAMGGLIFGMLGDRFGRARMMIVTILTYSIFTGISSLSTSFWDFALWRFLTGLGVGGEFAVGVALIAETLPEKARSAALGWLQTLTTVGNVTAAFIMVGIGPTSKIQLFGSEWTGWRVMFLIGTVPALLALLIRWRLKEPERWTAVAGKEQVKKQLGSYRTIFSDPKLKRHALIGLTMAVAGVIGLWGVAFFIFDFVGVLYAEGRTRGEINDLKFATALMLNVGAFFGMWAFSQVTRRLGRKRAFAIFFVIAMISIATTFLLLNEVWHIYVLIPFMGFGILSLFAGYAIYFPELFPTSVRSTGVSFCYNVGRFIAAIGPFTLGALGAIVFSEKVYGNINSWRYSGASMSLFLLIGLIALRYAPETKDQPLPE